MSQHLSRLFLAACLSFAALPFGLASASTPGPGSGGQARPSGMELAAQQAAAAVPADPRPFTAAVPLATRPGAAQTATAQTSGAGGARPEVFGYANAGNLGSAAGTSSWRFQDLTTVAFFGLHVNADGTLANDGAMSVWNSQDLTNLINAAHPNGVKVVVSIIQQSQSSLCSSLANAQTTVTAVINQINAKGVDGVNIDYEGSQATCGASGDTMATRLDNLARLFHQQLPAGRSDLTIATYTSAAYYSGGFFDIPGLAQYVDRFFVMAYDLDGNYGGGNWQGAPLNCSSYCFSPTGPLSTYGWNDQRAVSTYTSVVSPSKVILGVPYYGYTACVAPTSAARPGPNAVAYPASTAQWTAPKYLDSITTNGYTGVSNWQESRDPHDTTEPYSTWQSSTYGCWRESYWDDPSSLGSKYDLVTTSGIAGAGLFALDYGGGDAGLWGAIEYHLTCPVSVTVPGSVTSTQFQVTMNPPGGCARTLDLQEQDQTMGSPWLDVVVGGSPGTTTVSIDTYAGHTYAFRARANDIHGRTDDWTPIAPTVSVPKAATPAHAFSGLYSLDAFGGVHGVDSAPLAVSGYWAGWKIAHSLAQLPNGQPGGYVADGWGGVHPYGSAPPATISAYWNGWDIVRSVQVLPDGTGGYVLDGWGGIHPFAIGSNPMPPAATLSAYWRGWDIARGLVILPTGTGGYVLDGWGAIHPFAIGSNPMPPTPQATAYWHGWDIARGIALVPGTTTGYVLDGWGGLHPFGGAPAGNTTAYWKGWDIARSLFVTLSSGQPEGYVLDGWGGVHPFNGMPGAGTFSYWPGWDIVRGLSGS